jgi:DNA adenine methylase
MDIQLNDPYARPFLKWAGGKRLLLPEILPRIPDFEGRYIEPFVGAGAVMLSIPVDKQKIANDFNPELIAVYVSIRDHREELEEILSTFKNTEKFFLKIRSWDREDDYKSRSIVQKAARFIYLNKTCFNGLYRVNSRGEFNVPFGHYKAPEIFSTQHFIRISQILLGCDQNGKKITPKVSLKSGDYRNVTANAKKGDFIYLDPPYDPITTTSSFVSYHKNGFSRQHQVELRDELVRLNKLRIPFLLSNSDTPFIREIYSNKKIFKIESLQVRRTIGASASSRGLVGEVLVSNF